MEKAPFDWGLFWRTLLAVAGLVMILLGATELGIVASGEGGRTALGAGVLVAGLIALGYPVVVGFRAAIAGRRRGEG